MSKAKMVQVDGKKLKAVLKKNKLSMQDVSASLGRSSTYLSNVIITEKMPVNTHQLFCRIVGCDPSEILPTSYEPQEAAAKKYRMEMEVNPSKLHMELFFGDKSICSAYSKIKGESQLDLMQAISYAAHLMYKLTEQEELRNQE